ncbi:DNA helicase-2/ATP-dependent DNA helicase PcrA [Lachnospiraceae bacterium PF1-22]|uniref:HelD family protein n=1 Tax=Ohessyouella blattaphilus TaxID=2949333 RepID=UPI003E2D37A7
MQNHENKEESSPIFPDEIVHLEAINKMIDEALLKAQDSVERSDKEYMDMKRYMAEYRGELDPHEMFQNQLGLQQIDNTGAFAVTIRDKLAKLKESPYFARIDFRQDLADEAEPFYIGRFAFNYKNKLRISDWRSPLASMFYDYEVGPASYTAPMGKIDGDLTRKRQFKIKDGVMEYALESSANIYDDVLQQELSQTADEKMKSIIGTIQKEQNQIIRDEKSKTLIIQGVAGSGKTSIALHRIAFLLYRFKEQITANNVTILSPNKVFGDYISSVLPELGEEPIFEISFEDIARIQLEKVMDFEVDKDPFAEADEAWILRKQFKSSLEFVKRMDDFIEEMPEIIFEPVDYTYGRFTFPADNLRMRFAAYNKHPVKQRLQMLADEVYERFATDNFMEEDIPRSRTILKALKAMLKVKNTLELYRKFYEDMGQSAMFVLAGKKKLEWGDVFPFLYLHAAYEGVKESGVIRHLVVDEMQDYSPIQYAVLNRLFPCPKTILGDFGQSINPLSRHTLDDLVNIYKEAQLVKLNTSYRSSYEIINFAKQIQANDELKAIKRHGPIPEVIGFDSPQIEMQKLRQLIQSYRKSKYHTLGIIVKTKEAARILFDSLSSAEDLHLISDESRSFEGGISVTSVQMAKGLEFDEVIIMDVDQEFYRSEYDRSLLYVACTRAMHQLSVLYAGSRSLLLPGGGEYLIRK